MKLVPIKQNVSDTDVIDRLKECLDIVKGGGVINCAVIMLNDDGSVTDCWANRSNPFVMVGAIENLKQDFMRDAIEQRE